MNIEEIRRALQNVKHFYDVYSIDTLPARPRGILVYNLDPSYRSGNTGCAFASMMERAAIISIRTGFNDCMLHAFVCRNIK